MTARFFLGRALLAATLLAGAAPLGATSAGAQTPVLVPDVPDVSSKPAPSALAISASQKTRKLTLSLGKSIIVDLPAEASEVFVGNPAIANAVVRSARRLYVMAVSKGQTTIFALDKAGRQIATLDLLVNERDVGELKAILDSAIPNNDIEVKAVYDTIILTGSVASAVEAQRAQDIAKAFVGYSAVGGGVGSNTGAGGSVSVSNTQVVGGGLVNSLVIRGQEQVSLKVSVVEIQRDIVKQLGVNLSGAWGLGSASAAGRNLNGGPLQASDGTATSTLNGSNVGNLTNLILPGKNSLQASLQAYERNGVAHIMAEPTVTAISGESAKFRAGGTIPVISSSSLDPTTGRCTVTSQQQEYGVKLNFTPVVLSEGRISLHIETEVTQPDPQQTTAVGCTNIIGFKSRTNSTTIELPSGGSIVSAGLIEQQSAQVIAGTPGLMNLPILGALFRSRDYSRSETELMIIVTPYVVRPLKPSQISRPDDGFTDATDPQSWLLGRFNKIYSTANNPDLIRTYRGRVGFIAD